MDSFRIKFELRSLAEVAPWGNPETGLSLHWFGLTDGWYDLIIGEQHLFRTVANVHGIAYQVVRLWEDLIDIVPTVLDEIPDALANRLATGDRWTDWVERAWSHSDAGPEQDVATSWWSAREFDTTYLRRAPRLHLWRHSEEVHIRWRSLPRQADDPNWESPRGDAIVDAVEVRDQLVQFDRALIDAMRVRVDAVARGWTRPEVAIDVDEMCREHEDRGTWLERALRTERPMRHSWSEVLAAIAILENRIGSVLA